MNYVYILESLKNGRYYIGSTNNLERRIKEHNTGKSRYTKLTKPFKIIYSESYNTRMGARKRELYLKKLKSKKYIDWLISRRAISSAGQSAVLIRLRSLVRDQDRPPKNLLYGGFFSPALGGSKS